MEDAKCGITSEDEVFKAHEVEGNKIVLFKQFDEGRSDYDGEYVAKSIAEFVATSSMPTLVEFNGETANKIFGGIIKKHLILFLSSTSEDFKAQSEMATEVAKEHKGKILFVYIDVSKADSSRVLDFFNAKAEDAPAMRMTHLGESMIKYKPEVSNLDDNDEFVANIKAFVDGVESGKIQPHLKSDDIPADWDSKGVKVLVGKNFADVALDAEKHVLVEFYAPWCGHCKSLAPIYDELGEKYKDSKDIVIAKMDSTTNEVKDVNIRGFPTLKLFKKGDNKVVEYDGARDLDGFVKFLDALEDSKDAEATKKDEL
jgi:protein disulfide-isomerase A1